MVKFALLARLEAKSGKEQEVENFIKGALPLAQQETETVSWFALRIGPSTFGIFDTFETEDGRKAHLGGEIAKALMAQAPELLASDPVIEQVDILASK
ncbi:putative quinol monooxygenase [Mucilaginibacter sp.]|jgi:quinol monooxygenase YgiN|uniref:putative quinol monooxygenase n=1 Tax=Mucilaginibacter sp. TaxID=1882438 RepID=UPI00356888D1